MKENYLSVDIGGTNTRIFLETRNDEKSLQKVYYSREICSENALRNFIEESLNKSDLEIKGAVFGFAGAVIEHKKVEMTNWPDKPVITKSLLENWNSNIEQILMVNDMELAAYGLIDLKEKGKIPSEICETLYKSEKLSNNRINNMLVIAPGTGFGTASVINIKNHSGENIYDVLSSEIQHIQAAPIDKRQAELIKIIHSQKPDRKFINYEDFVSGKGLEETYAAIQQLDKKEVTSKSAAEIAQSALNAEDKIAVEALNIFYETTARLTQAMALMIQPYGGIFLCGASTIHNKDFIQNSRFLAEFHNCLIRKQLLEQFPIYIVTEKDINLLGGIWAARNVL